MKIAAIISKIREINNSDEFAERLADWMGVYGSPEGDHEEDCECRICFTIAVTDCIERIHQNEQDEKILSAVKERLNFYKNIVETLQ
jgi:hypothetical protein